MSNVIRATFDGGTRTITAPAYQWDYGQILYIEDLELPEAYEVHFANELSSGETITQIGNADGVTIPDEFFTEGKMVYAWIYLHTGENDGETEYSISIPVTARPQPSDTPPTPQEQSAINQAIAALNIAVEKSDTNVLHYPKIENGTWWVWDANTDAWVDTQVEAQGEQGQPGRDGTDGQDGQDGFSPVITVTDITGGHRVTITDATGTQTVDVLNGQPGIPGTDGTDGYSPTVTVTEITGGHRVVITDKNGSHTFDVMDGSDATVTVDDELDDQSENPVQNKVITEEILDLKADINNKIDKPQTSGTNGQVLTSDGQGGQTWQTPADCDVTDVQIDGTSIVNNGVANIQGGGDNTLGVLQTDSQYGTSTLKRETQGGALVDTHTIAIIKASNSQIKNGNGTCNPIVPSVQDRSVFYGLAKAAGDSTQSASSNPVGTYTNDAKEAIQTMLDVPSSGDVINDVQVNGTSVVSNGVANVPVASTSELGAVYDGGSYGYYGITVANDGRLQVTRAEDSNVKAGTQGYRPIVPYNQHSAAFYGLAKASGDTTQSASSNPVGTYTDDAKVAIQKMLGIYEAPWELIREDTVTNATEADIDITVDGNGQPFELTDVILFFETPKQETASAKGSSGQVFFYHGAGSSNRFYTETGAWTQAENGSAHGVYIFFEQKTPIVKISATGQTTSSNRGALNYRYSESVEKATGIYYNNTGTPLGIIRVLISAVTGTGHYKLYGKRTWS